MPVRIGTSGWQYADWKGRFYPRALPVRRWLEYYASQFETVEVNNAFYRLPEVETFARWRDATPPGFVLALKASRYLTHVRRLRDPAEPVERLLGRASGLGAKLGPVLLQLPPTLRADLGALRAALEAFPRTVRVVVEPRHESWDSDDTLALLQQFDAALCLSDDAGPRAPLRRTASWGYVRFHRGRAHPLPCYGRAALASWAGRLAALWSDRDDVYAYFNNDTGGCAVRDAHRFGLAVARVGLTPSRVPDARRATLTLEPAQAPAAAP